MPPDLLTKNTPAIPMEFSIFKGILNMLVTLVGYLEIEGQRGIHLSILYCCILNSFS